MENIMEDIETRGLVSSMQAEIQKISEVDPVAAVTIDLSGRHPATVCGPCWTKTPVPQA